MKNLDHDDARWNLLLDRYREACGEPEGDRNFMPGLWQKIDARRSRTKKFERTATSLFAAAVGLSLVLGAFLVVPNHQPSAFLSGSYVEELASANTTANGTFFEPVRLEYGVPPLMLSRGPVWAYLLLVFAGGGVVGVFADRLYTVKSVRADVRPTPDEYRKRYVAELKSRLKLDPPQVDKLNAILESTQQSMHALHEREKPEMTAIHQEQVDKVHSILNEKQIVEYEKMRDEREKRRAAERH